MKTIEEVVEMWKVDAETDPINPHHELLNIPKLHCKYSAILSESRLALKKIKNKYLKEKRFWYEYYDGKVCEEELIEKGLEPFRFVLKNNIDFYLDSNDQLISILDKKVYFEELVSLCESILKELNNRTFALNSYIKYTLFLKGVN